jgi:hypothetical protein
MVPTTMRFDLTEVMRRWSMRRGEELVHRTDLPDPWPCDHQAARCPAPSRARAVEDARTVPRPAEYHIFGLSECGDADAPAEGATNPARATMTRTTSKRIFLAVRVAPIHVLLVDRLPVCGRNPLAEPSGAWMRRYSPLDWGS